MSKKTKSFEEFHAMITVVSVIGLIIGYIVGSLNTMVLFGFLAVIDLMAIAVLQKRE